VFPWRSTSCKRPRCTVWCRGMGLNSLVAITTSEPPAVTPTALSFRHAPGPRWGDPKLPDSNVRPGWTDRADGRRRPGRQVGGPAARAAVPRRSPSARQPGCQPMMFTARATTSTTAATETADWSIIMAFAQRVSGVTSLEAKEMALLNDR